jgi:DNA-binding protein HU-beta
MTKSEFIKSVASKLNVPNTKASECLDALLETISKTLTKGDSISFVGFGKFSVKKRAAHMGRNPKTGEALKITARKIAHFSAGKNLKTAVNKK